MKWDIENLFQESPVFQHGVWGLIKKMAKIVADKRLFWFLKEGIQLNLREPSVLDMYVQQVISNGSTEDIRTLLRTLKLSQIKDALRRIKRFIPVEVRRFWEDLIADNK